MAPSSTIAPRRFFIPFFIGSIVPFVYNQVFTINVYHEHEERHSSLSSSSSSSFISTPSPGTAIKLRIPPTNITTTTTTTTTSTTFTSSAPVTSTATAATTATTATAAVEEPNDRRGHAITTHTDGNEHLDRGSDRHTCAKWIHQSKPNRRRVLFIDFSSSTSTSTNGNGNGNDAVVDASRNNDYSKNGSASASASASMWSYNAFTIGPNLKKLLIANDFHVFDYDITSDSERLNMITLDELSSFHRIFFIMHSKSNVALDAIGANDTSDDNDDDDNNNRNGLLFLRRVFSQRGVLCKLRVVVTDSTLWNKDNDLQEQHMNLFSRMDKKQILLDFPNEKKGTFFGGSFIFDFYNDRKRREKRKIGHSKSTSSSPPPTALSVIPQDSTKVGVLSVVETKLNLNDSIIDRYYRNTLESLIENNFTIHVLCDKIDSNRICSTSTTQTQTEEGIIVHHQITEQDFNEIVSNAAFVMGEYIPSRSSIFWIGLANGAAIININTKTHNQKDDHSSLPFQLEKPYVYDVDLGDIESTTRAVETAAIARFESHIPSHFRAGTMNDRVCALLEDDSLCSCPNPLFEVVDSYDYRTKEQNKNRNKNHDAVDCRSSFFVKKSPIFPRLV